MMNKKLEIQDKGAFTLVEILVSITILSIIMISVVSIFVSATDISLKSDINRSMQENIKNVVETIANDLRKNWVSWVSKNSVDNCDFTTNYGKFYKRWTKLCVWPNSYYLAKKDTLWAIIRVSNDDCLELRNHCFIVKSQTPLSNSSVSFKNLEFLVSNESVSKVTIKFELQPAVKRWVKSSLIKENKMIFQTSISQRLIK